MVGGVANPSCSFSTVTRALQVVGGFAVAGTQIIIVGQSGQTRAARREPRRCRSSCRRTSPSRRRTDRSASTCPPAAIPTWATSRASSWAAIRRRSRPIRRRRSPSTADRNSSGIGIGVSPGAGKSASLSYVTVQNTGGHGIAVSSGTLAIGQGVTVTGAGTALKRRDGLNVARRPGQHHGHQRPGADRVQQQHASTAST